MAYARTHCPGSGHLPRSYGLPSSVAPLQRGICAACRREYALTGDGVMRLHRGLPLAPDGGCPYHCPLDCDFDCYFPEVGA